MGLIWPRLGRQVWYRGLERLLEEASRGLLIALTVALLAQSLSEAGELGFYGLLVRKLSPGEEMSLPSVQVEREETGEYHVRLRGEFALHVDGEVEFYKRMLVIFRGLLEAPGSAEAVAARGMGGPPSYGNSRWLNGSVCLSRTSAAGSITGCSRTGAAC